MTSHRRIRYFEELGKDFNLFMDDYDVHRRLNLIFNHLLSDIFFTGKSALEVGSGTGRFSREILRRNVDLTVLDIGKKLVREVVMENRCQGVAGDATTLPFENNSFDLVISSECIEHTTDPFSAVREMCRVCKPGGVVCFTTPNRVWYPLLVLSQLLKVRKFAGIENWIFPSQAAGILKQCGMTRLSFGGCHLLPFQLKFLRFLLSHIDEMGSRLYPLMINFGVVAVKPDHRGPA